MLKNIKQNKKCRNKIQKAYPRTKRRMRMKMIMKMKMMKQWVKTKKNKIKKLNDHLDEIIDKSKSFEGQIKSIKN